MITCPRFIVVCVGPVSMKFNDIWVFQLSQVFEHHLYFVLLRLKISTFGKLHLVPHDFHTFFCIHCQVCAVNPWYIPLLHLKRKNNRSWYFITIKWKHIKQLRKITNCGFSCVSWEGIFLLSFHVFQAIKREKKTWHKLRSSSQETSVRRHLWRLL